MGRDECERESMNTNNTATERTAQDKLDEYLGIDNIEPFVISTAIGYEKGLEYNSNDPCAGRTSQGTITYHAITKYLRSYLLREYDWKPKSHKNLEYSLSPDRSNAIAVSHAYFQEGKVRTAGKKGLITRRAVQCNERQLCLNFPDLPTPSESKVGLKDAILWYLLHDMDRKTGIIQLQLAVPIAFENDEPSQWDHDRVVFFDSFKLNEISIDSVPEDDDETPIKLERL